MIPVFRILAAGVTAAALSFACLAAQAQSGEKVSVRGTVVSLDGAALVVHSREGADVAIRLAGDFSIVGIVKASMTDIKPGVFIGTASMPQTDASLRALEVVVFPEAMRGVGEGHFPWDLKPSSTMTNATVGNSVDGVDGRTVTLSYKGGEKTITIPAQVPIVTVGKADKTDITSGAVVFVPTQRQPDGALESHVVIVGKDGAVPPM